ncbi:MAG: hypothetical protein ACOYJI_05675 [Anaerovoracaceae bacterium]|jgi:hypothetical protein
MDNSYEKKSTDKNKPFDANTYIRDYQRKNYKRYTAIFSRDDSALIDKSIAKSGMSKSKFIQEAILEKIKRDNLL